MISFIPSFQTSSTTSKRTKKDGLLLLWEVIHGWRTRSRLTMNIELVWRSSASDASLLPSMRSSNWSCVRFSNVFQMTFFKAPVIFCFFSPFFFLQTSFVAPGYQTQNMSTARRTCRRKGDSSCSRSRRNNRLSNTVRKCWILTRRTSTPIVNTKSPTGRWKIVTVSTFEFERINSKIN